MRKPLRILHLEDDPDFHELLRGMLQSDGVEAQLKLVATRTQFDSAIAEGDFDLIVADYLLPDFNGIEALRRVREAMPQLPFLLVSGTIGEQAAIDSLRAGATDYVLKQWPDRLIPAIRRAATEAEERAQRRRVETELIRREKHFRTLTENALDIITALSRDGFFIYNSPSMKRVLGYEPASMVGRNSFEFVHPDDLPLAQAALAKAVANPLETITTEFRFRHENGTWRYLEAVGQSRLGDPAISAVVVNSRDITDRKGAEDALRESEKQYRLIFDGNQTPMYVFDQKTLHLLEVNDAALQHYGYSRTEFLQLNLRDLRPHDEVPALIEYVDKLFPEGQPTKLGLAGVWRHRRKDNSLIDVEVKWSPISFDGRQASLVMANDITERKRIEERDSVLSKLGQYLSGATSPDQAARIICGVAEELFRWDAFTLDLYDAQADLIFPTLNIDTSKDGKKFEIPLKGEGKRPSPMGRRIITTGSELILRKHPVAIPADSVPIGDVSRLSASLMLVPVRNRTTVIGVLSIQSYTGNAYSNQDLSTLQTLADHCGGALERIRAEQALRQSELLFHSVWENSADGMRLTDENGKIVAVNDAYCKLVGIAEHEIQNQPLTVVYANGQLPDNYLDTYCNEFKARTIQKKGQARIKFRTGQEVILEETNSLVEREGKTPLLLSLFRDVSAQTRLEEQLRQAQKMEAIGQLAGGVAHDFNNILTIIHGHAALLGSGGTLSASSTRSAHQIVHAAERAAALTRQLLAFSRRQVMQSRRLDLNEVVENVSKMLGRILGEDIVLHLTFYPAPAFVQADATMMEQVLMNLAVNSRDAMPKGGRLDIQVGAAEFGPEQLISNPERQPGNFVVLRIQDTGTGIPPEILPRIFEPFFTTKEVGKGTGLGLATVYGILKQHRGWIEVESQLGVGTHFTVYLPSSVEAQRESIKRKSESPAVRGGSETILVVEDEALLRELVCSLLGSHGYKILEAESGVKALNVWEAHRDKIDLVLTDLVMPDRLNGRELAEKLWAERPELKVIFTSGYSADVVGKDFVLRKGLRYLQKPYPPHKLACIVRECLDVVN